jgi:signal transduction histidine kinase
MFGGGFYVADDGPGIPPAPRRDRVVELGHTDAEDGSGLRSAIVREVADAHGWTVHATGSETGGARFGVVTDGAASERPE